MSKKKHRKGHKNDSDKLRYDLLPFDCLNEIIRVLMYGAGKYGDFDWQNVPDAKQRYFAALMRHLVTWWTGEKLDKESGLNHLAHACCCLFFLLWFERKGK